MPLLAELAAQTYVEHYCNGMAYTVVETQEDGSEKWYAPTGGQIMTPAEMQAFVETNLRRRLLTQNST